MTKDEALRLALEALISCHNLLEIEVNKAIARDAADAWIQEKEAELRQHNNAITAIKAALEAKDEPVAWYRNEDGIRIYYESKVWDDVIPLYTTPPQRALDISNNVSQRLLLTDEPIGNAIDAWFKRNSDGTYGTWRERMRAAIKAAHGIKGEA